MGKKYYTDMRGIHAEGILTENGFTILAGSEVRNHEASYLAKAVKELRRQHLQDGTIVDWKTTRDLDFNSSSTAA